MDQHRSLRLGRHYQCDTDQVGRKTGPGHIVDLGDGAVEIGPHLEFLGGRHDDILTLVVPLHAQPTKNNAGHAVFLGTSTNDAQSRPGRCGQADQRPHFHIVGTDNVGGTGHFFDTLYGQAIGANTANLRPHSVEAVTHVLDVGFRCRIGYSRYPIG